MRSIRCRSREGDLSSEISKVEREKTPEKVRERNQYVCNHLEECNNILFNKDYNILAVKSIILSTKPCFYYYVNKSEDYEYMEWIEFEERIQNRVF